MESISRRVAMARDPLPHFLHTDTHSKQKENGTENEASRSIR